MEEVIGDQRVVEIMRPMFCSYCKKELKREFWRSEWDFNHPDEHHYKSIKCECGKKNWVKVEFVGSGHDLAFKQDFSPLESAVRKVREK